MMPGRRQQVVFAVRYVNHYREAFYSGLRDHLADRGVDFRLIYGTPSDAEALKQDAVDPDWGTRISNRVLSLGRHHVVYQPLIRLTGKADLVIVEQASRLLVNYPLVLRHGLGRGPKLAMIGHGANLASEPHPIGEVVKRVYTRQLDWFFAYTEGTKNRLSGAGFPEDRVTVFENTLDLTSLAEDLGSVTDLDIASFRREHGLGSAPIVLVLGSIYGDKRPDLVVPVSKLLADRNVDHAIVVMGDGPDRPALERETEGEPSIVLVPPAFDKDKAVALKAADVLLIPGVAGLIILDGFAAGLPILTAINDHHPPEIDYLEEDNSLVVAEATAENFAMALERLLGDAALRRALGASALTASKGLTIDNMIQRFSDGVIAALDAEKIG